MGFGGRQLVITGDEVQLLSRHGFHSFDVLWVGDQRPRDWKVAAKESGFDLVLVESSRCGHRLKTRTNSCFECNPQSIKRLQRHYRAGTVYIAYAEEVSLLKVGSTENIDIRMKTLRNQGYGEVNDWRLIAAADVSCAGKIETQLLNMLPGERREAGYLNRHNGQRSRELIKCAPRTAWWHFVRLINRVNGRIKFKHAELTQLDYHE